MSQHPEVEARLAAELDAAELLATRARTRPRPLAHADLGRLVYLQCVLKVPLLIDPDGCSLSEGVYNVRQRAFLNGGCNVCSGCWQLS